MKILLDALSKVHVWCLGKDMYWILLWAVIVFIIGYLILKGIEKEEKSKEIVGELNRRRLQDAIVNASPAQIAKAFGSFKTINIYWDKKLHIELHKRMIRLLQTHLEMEGFKLSMTSLDCELMKTWCNPVLVIYPEKSLYFFHPDQDESRSGSHSFTIATNNLNALASEIDNQIALMRGVSNA